jgi:hypothetical protein
MDGSIEGGSGMRVKLVAFRLTAVATEDLDGVRLEVGR